MQPIQSMLLAVREWMKPLANMKNAMSISSAITSLMNHTGLPEALRRVVQGWVLMALGVIVGAALLLSLMARHQRDRWSVRPYWEERGRKNWVASVLALLFGSLSLHRFYMRRYITGVLQLLGIVPFFCGAYLLSQATMIEFVALSDAVVGGVLFFLIGLAFVVWRLLDLFLILFGGLIPAKPHHRHRREKLPPEPPRPELPQRPAPLPEKKRL